MTKRVFERLSNDGHASIFKSRMAGSCITIEIHRETFEGNPIEILTTLQPDDAKRFAQWILEKYK